MNNYGIKITIITLFVGILCMVPGTVTAQQQGATTESINLTTESRFYGPNETATVKLSSNLINLTNAGITWSKNGEMIASEVGKTEVDVTTKSVGEPIEIGVQAQIPSRGSINRKLEITPVDVDLIWESTDSFVPKFFQGKALHPGWGPVKVTVIPHIPRKNQRNSRYKANELVYNWSFNNLVYGDDSGRGKNTFTFDGTPRQNRVRVEIETPGGDPVASRTIVVPTTDPQITFYPTFESRGVVLSQMITESEEISGEGVSAQPFYYLANSPQAGNLAYDWRINNQEVDVGADKNQIMFSNDVLDNGENNISLEINDESHLLFPSESVDRRISL